MAAERFERPGIIGWLHEPRKSPRGTMLLSHGASAGCESPLMVAVAEAFEQAGFLVLRWDLPFRQARRSPSLKQQAIDREGIRSTGAVLREMAPGAPLILAGHSYGGRQSTMVAAEDPSSADALLLLSYPLHAPQSPESPRTVHFPKLRTPALFVHGTRDPFGAIEEMDAALKLIRGRKKLMVIEGAKHGVPPKTAASLPPALVEFLGIGRK